MPVIDPSASFIAEQAGAFEPQRKNNWAIEFTLGNGEQEKIMSLSLKGSPFPKESNVKKSIKYFNETRHYAGAVTPFESLSVKYHDYVDRQILAALYAWRREVWDPNTGAIGLAAQYKKRGRLYFYPPNVVNGGDSRARTWVLIGCWPVSVTTDELDMESDGDNVEITLEVSIDRALPDFGAGSSISQGLMAQYGVGSLGGLAGA